MSSDLHPVAENDAFVRDSRSKAFVNFSGESYREFCERQREKIFEQQRVRKLEKEVESLHAKLDMLIERVG